MISDLLWVSGLNESQSNIFNGSHSPTFSMALTVQHFHWFSQSNHFNGSHRVRQQECHEFGRQRRPVAGSPKNTSLTLLAYGMHPKQEWEVSVCSLA
jgi:hypothetical protein